VRVQNRIKAELRFHGIEIANSLENWSKAYLIKLRNLSFNDDWMQESFTRLLDEYQYLCDQVVKQTSLLRKLSQSEMYCEQVKILRSMPGIGLVSAMEIMLELGDISRFHRADQLAAYVGLTPSQYSSGERVRMGRITCVGKGSLRGILVETAWKLIGRDQAMREKYERIKMRSGSKRAIVAIARRVLLCARRMLLDKEQYNVAIAV
jgi:transposase